MGHARSGSLPHVAALDGLRGLAVLAVVAFHLWPGLFPGGWLGVDLFFVLSGYLITGILTAELTRTGRIGLGTFWARRARRLLPAALATITVVAVAGHWLLSPWRLAALRGDALASLAYVANWRFVATGNSYFAAGSPSPLEHLWSLAIEEQFYVLWPILLLGAWHLARGRALRIAGVAALLAMASAGAMAILAHEGGSRAYFGTDTRSQALLVGAVLALTCAHRRTNPSSALGDRRASIALRTLGGAGPLALGGLVVMVMTVGGESPWLYRGGFAVVAVLGVTVVWAAVGTASPPLTALLERRSLRTVGHVSYGLYLWHWPVIVLLTSTRVGVHGAALDVVHIAVFSALTALSYRFVEQPIRYSQAAPRIVARRSAPAAVAVVGVVLLGTIGAASPPRLLQEEAGTIQTVPQPLRRSPASAPPAASSSTVRPGNSADRTTGSTAPPQPLDIGVVGDSIGLTLAYYGGPPPGVRLYGGGTLGCGVVATSRCADWQGLWRLVDRANPRIVVVVLGAWEVVEQSTPDGTYRPGSEPARALVLDHLEQGLSLLPPESKIAMLDVPCLNGIDGERPVDANLLDWINGVFRDFVARHPDRASLVPISELLCPGAKSDDVVVDGVNLRPGGRHFDEKSAPVVWRWLLPRLRALLDN